jgi:hypothetical protein
MTSPRPTITAPNLTAPTTSKQRRHELSKPLYRRSYFNAPTCSKMSCRNPVVAGDRDRCYWHDKVRQLERAEPKRRP